MPYLGYHRSKNGQGNKFQGQEKVSTGRNISEDLYHVLMGEAKMAVERLKGEADILYLFGQGNFIFYHR